MTKQGGMIRPYSSTLALVFRVSDIAIIGFLAWILAAVRGVDAGQHHWYLLLALLSGSLFYLFGSVGNVYRSWRGVSLREECELIIRVWFLTVGVLFLIGYVTKTTAAYSRVAVTSWILVTPGTLALWRHAVRFSLRAARKKGRNLKCVAIAGVSQTTMEVLDEIEEHPEMGFRITGIYTDTSPTDPTDFTDFETRIRGTINDLISEAREGNLDIVYVTYPLSDTKRIGRIISELADSTVSLFLVPSLLELDLLRAQWSSLGDISTISVYDTPFYGVDGLLKRLEDLIVSSVCVLIAAIPMALIALALKLSSSGPVFFRQRRYGIDGKEITVWKFRTMTVCEEGRDELRQATSTDERVTKFGRFLRRTSLDELPQLFNVLRGTMSLVGPRPHAVVHNEQYRKLIHGYMLRHKVKPGITGLAQVRGWRGETDSLEKMEKRVECDLEYIRSWSMLLDMKIIATTLVKGFLHKNAY